MEQTAREMFKELGFEYEYFRTPIDEPHNPNRGMIWYVSKHENLTIIIRFQLFSRRWMITGDYGNGIFGGIQGSIELFLAIQKQMKELAWI